MSESPLNKVAEDAHKAYEQGVQALTELGKSLIGHTALCQRGRNQVILVEVLGAKDTIITVRNLESEAGYYLDLRKSKVVKVKHQSGT